jgi:hypothetical protein
MVTMVTRQQLRDLLGDELSDAMLDRMIETGATIYDVASAIEVYEAELRGEAIDRTALSIQAYEVREILDDATAAGRILTDLGSGAKLGERNV